MFGSAITNDRALCDYLWTCGQGPLDWDAQSSATVHLRGSEVTRTVFDGVDRSAELGVLSAEGILGVPGRSVVTVALR